MKEISKLFLLACVVISFASCSITGPLIVTDNAGPKTGESSYKILLGGIILGKGDASIKSACEDGGITKISTVDQKVESSGFLTTKIVTIVTGE